MDGPIRTMLCVLSVTLLSSLLATEAASAQDLDEIRTSVQNNFLQVRSLTLDVDVVSVNVLSVHTDVDGTTTRLPPTKVVNRSYSWTFQEDGKEYLLSRERLVTRGVEGDVTAKTAFNGDSLRNFIDRGSAFAPKGTIMLADEVHRTLTLRAPGSTGAGRAWGRIIDDVSLPDWLGRDEARVTGTAKFGTFDSVVVEIPYTHDYEPEATWMVRLFLVEGMNYALSGWESYKDGELVFRITNTESREILPGVWFPISGTSESFYRGLIDDQARPSSTFEVRNIEVNVELPQELFDIEYPVGTIVSDRRLGKYSYVVGGADESTHREMLASVGEQILDPELPQSDEASASDEASVSVDQTGPSLAVGVDTTPVEEAFTFGSGAVLALILGCGVVLTILALKFAK